MNSPVGDHTGAAFSLESLVKAKKLMPSGTVNGPVEFAVRRSYSATSIWLVPPSWSGPANTIRSVATKVGVGVDGSVNVNQLGSELAGCPAVTARILLPI